MQLQAIELADDLSRNRIYWKHFKVHRIDERLLNQVGKTEEGQGAERVSQVAVVVKNPPVRADRLKRCQFNYWIGKIPWRRAWQPTLAFFPGQSPWTEGPVGLQCIGWQRVGHN